MLRFADSLLGLIGVLSLAAASEAGVTYFVASHGSDSADGRSDSTAWRTLERVNSAQIKPGDAVLFRRGDSWRGQLHPQSGDPSGYVTYGAYSSGVKPVLLGSVSKSTSGDWQRRGEHIWATTDGKAVLLGDVGNIIFDGGPSCGTKVWQEADLKAQGDYWYDRQRYCVKMYSVASPASHYRTIECALRQHIIEESNASWVVYENLALKYGGAHGIGGSSTHHIIVRDCDFSFIGGGDQYGDGRKVRFGNAIEFWGNAHDNLVARCRFWEIYDAALTNQNNGPGVIQASITYRHNLIWNCEYSFEYWNRPESSHTKDIVFEHNTCVNAGAGWGHTQRPDPSGRHLCFYSSPAQAQNIRIRNNIFFMAKGNAFYAPSWSEAAVKELDVDYNCWYQPKGVMISVAGNPYRMESFSEYQAKLKLEPHSNAADPLLASVPQEDFRLRKDSPCIGAGNDLKGQQDSHKEQKNRGKASDIGACRNQADE